MSAGIHLIAFILCTVAAFLTVVAAAADTAAATLSTTLLIMLPLLVALGSGLPATVLLFYYIAGIMLLVGLGYGYVFLMTAAEYGFVNTVRGIASMYGLSDQPSTTTRPSRRQQQQPTTSPDEIVMWTDQEDE